MKKIFISVLAVAALAACSKSEVSYETPAEIGLSPVKGNVTKAEGKSGALANDQELGIWAYWDNDGAVETSVADYTKYNDNYLVNALFASKTVNSKTAWGGAGDGYPWPVNGALVFAGYTTPGNDVLGSSAVSYDLGTDKMVFTNYENTNEFDLCWFGRTSGSYNNRQDGAAIAVDLSHALSWISVAVYGEGMTVDKWTVKKMTLENVISKGTGTCVGNNATWQSVTTGTNTIYTGTHLLTAGTTANGTTTGVKLTDNVLIPSKGVKLTVEYDFLVNGQTKTDTKTITLNADQAWESGKHYTYTLVFKSNEILVSPSYGDWTSAPDQTVTVE